MARFQLTMNMPSVNNNLVHQVICDYPVGSLEELLDALNDADFVLVTQYYKERDGRLVYKGGLIVNTALVGKAAVYDPDGPQAVRRPS